MRRDFVQTRVMNLDAESMASFRAQFTALEKEAEKWYAQENIPMDKRGKEYFLDMRYQGQNHEIRVPVDIDAITDEKELRAAFIKTYERLYSFSSDDAVQIVNFGLSAIGNIILPLVNEEAYAGEDPSKAIIGSRRVYEGGGCFKDYTLYDRDLLGNGNIINGPAIVEQMDSTTVILANQYAVVDKYLNMIIERRPKGGDDNE
jgi:N-methylhydantoinase A